MAQQQMSTDGYRVQNPATGEVLETFEHATDEEVQQILTRAAEGYRAWSEKTIEQRGEIGLAEHLVAVVPRVRHADHAAIAWSVSQIAASVGERTRPSTRTARFSRRPASSAARARRSRRSGSPFAGTADPHRRGSSVW